MSQEIPFSFTSSAIKEIKHIIEEKKVPQGFGLRVGIRGGGCSGISYMLGFDTLKENDLTYHYQGVEIYLEKKHAMYIFNKIIDFEDGVNARGFIFKD